MLDQVVFSLHGGSYLECGATTLNKLGWFANARNFGVNRTETWQHNYLLFIGSGGTPICNNFRCMFWFAAWKDFHMTSESHHVLQSFAISRCELVSQTLTLLVSPMLRHSGFIMAILQCCFFRKSASLLPSSYKKRIKAYWQSRLETLLHLVWIAKWVPKPVLTSRIWHHEKIKIFNNWAQTRPCRSCCTWNSCQLLGRRPRLNHRSIPWR